MIRHSKVAVTFAQDQERQSFLARSLGERHINIREKKLREINIREKKLCGDESQSSEEVMTKAKVLHT